MRRRRAPIRHVYHFNASHHPAGFHIFSITQRFADTKENTLTGGFSADVTIPASATLGTQEIQVAGRTSGQTAEQEFRVR